MSEEKSNPIIKVLGSIVVPIITALIGAGMTYFVTTYEKAPPPETEVAIEAMPAHIFAFAGNNNPEGGWSVFDLYFVDDLKSKYIFKYSLPTDGQAGYAGLTFKFEQSTDLSNFETISFLLAMPPTDEVDLVIKDIAGAETRYRLKGGPQQETQMNIPLSNFKDLNLKAVREVMFYVDIGFITGDHSLSVRDMKFLH